MIAAFVFAFAALAADVPTDTDARLLGELLANAAQHKQTEVVSQGDVKRAADLDAERQMLGDCSESCMAEVAAAMGARLVLEASLGSIGDETVCTLSLYDSSSSKSERRIVRAGSTEAIMPLAEAETKALVSAAVAALPPSPPTKLLVLDVALRAPAEEAGAPVLGILGGVGLSVGALVAGGAVFADVLSVQLASGAAKTSTPAGEATAQRGTSDTLATVALASYIGGALALVAGAGLVIAQVVTAPDETTPTAPAGAPAAAR
jgi:hypothetical protein